MKHSYTRQVILPFIAALIWGTAFAAQSVIAEHIGPFTFNAVRAAIAIAFLGLVLIVINIIKKRRKNAPSGVAGGEADTKKYRVKLILGGLLCGSMLTLASSLQQRGMAETSAGKAGFITALYIVIVPILGIFLRKKVPFVVLGSVALAATGLYFLCIDESFFLSTGDLYVILCAFVFSIHILIIDHFTKYIDGITLSFAQFFIMGIESGILMLLFEQPTASGIMACFWQLLYIGIFSSGVAYTLQMLAQKDSNPTVVALVLSLESLFAAVAGAIFLREKMQGREYFGCALMLVAVVLAQLPARVFGRRAKNKK